MKMFRRAVRGRGDGGGAAGDGGQPEGAAVREGDDEEDCEGLERDQRSKEYIDNFESVQYT